MAEGNGTKTMSLSKATKVSVPLVTVLGGGWWAAQAWEGQQEERLKAVEEAVQVVPVLQEAVSELKNGNRRIETKLDALLLQRNVQNNQIPSNSQPVTREAREQVFNPDYLGASGVRQ